jgi:hypothetical protein
MNKNIQPKIYIKYIHKTINKSLEISSKISLQIQSPKRKKCLIYGNCQTRPLSRILCANQEFSNKYDVIQFKPVFIIEHADLENLKLICKEVDVFIYQPVKSGYRGMEELGTDYLKNLLKPEAISIAFPSLYFNAYNPEIIYISKPNSLDDDKVFMGPLGQYHNKNIIDMFVRGCSLKEIMSFLSNPDALSTTSIYEKLKLSFEELARREVAFNIDVKITNYIKKYYTAKRLFYTINHPSNDIIFYCANMVLDYLNIYKTDHQGSFLLKSLMSVEFFDATYFSIHPSIYKSLELKFSNPSIYYFNNKAIALVDAVIMFLNFYHKNPHVIEEYLKNK